MTDSVDGGIRRPAFARTAVSALFFLLGAGFGSWAVRIPDIQVDQGLSNAALGTALLALAIGSLLGMPLAAGLAARLNAAGLARGCAIAFATTIAVVPHADGYAGFCAVLLLLGATNGALGVVMNAQAALWERQLGRQVLSSCHGIFSVGALSGGLTSGALAGAGVGFTVHLTAAGVLLSGLAVAVSPWLVSAAPAPRTPAFARPQRSLLPLGALAFCVLLCEGAVTDWSAVYLRDALDAGPAVAGTGYVAFTGAMATGRFAGDRLSKAWGPRRLVTAAGAVVLGGVGVILLAPSTAIVVGGFALLGAGLSVTFPNVLASATRQAPGRSSTSIAAVSTIGYFGFLAGPPLIGYLSEFTGPRGGLVPLAGCAGAVLLLAQTLRSDHHSDRHTAGIA